MEKKPDVLSIVQGACTAVTIIASIVGAFVGPKLQERQMRDAIGEELDRREAEASSDETEN
jgi:hypothetical protein